jgi:putative membrane protein
MNFLKPIFITFLSIIVLAWLVPAVSYMNWATLVVASLVLTVLNKLVRPVLKLLFLPVTIVTLGFFGWVINAAILWLAMVLVPGFHIDKVVIFSITLNRFFTLVFVSFALSVIQSLIDWVL